MRNGRQRILKATAQERRLIESLTATPAFDRLDAGQAELVDADDWSDVPQLRSARTVSLSENLYRRLQATSRRKRTTPDRLAARLLSRMLAKETAE